MSVLILYENGPTRAAMLDALERAGFEARAADNVFRAVAAFTERPAETVVLGTSALDERDLGAIDVLREIAPTVRVVLLFGPAQRELAARGLGAGADAYLLEPFYMEELLALAGRGGVPGSHDDSLAEDTGAAEGQRAFGMLSELAADAAHEIRNPLQIVQTEIDRKGGKRPRPSALAEPTERLAGVGELLAMLGHLGEAEPAPLDLSTLLEVAVGDAVDDERRAIRRTHPVPAWPEPLEKVFAALARRAAVFGRNVHCSCRNAYGPLGDYVEIVIGSRPFDDANHVEHGQIERPLLGVCARVIATRLGGSFSATESIEDGARYEWQFPVEGRGGVIG